MDATTVGVDLAKHVFQLAWADAHGRILEHRRVSRAQFHRWMTTAPPVHVVMEACGTAHYWGRVAQSAGHRVTLLPPAYVRPFVRRDKTDRVDAVAALEAARTGTVPTVPVKRAEQQALLALHRLRTQWVKTRTARVNALRGLLREQGVLLPAGRTRALRHIHRVLDAAGLPVPLQIGLAGVVDEIHSLDARVTAVEEQLAIVAAHDPVVQRLCTIPGIGLLTATALVAAVGHIHAFRRARQFASWLGLTPREHSSGSRRRLGRISKRGDTYLRTLLTHGARSLLIRARRRHRLAQPLHPVEQWALTRAAHRHANIATVAVANKLSRIVWAVWTHDQPFRDATA